MEEQENVSESLSEEELAYKELAARIEIIKQMNRESEKPHLSRKDYIQVIVIIVVCLCALVAGAFLAA